MSIQVPIGGGYPEVPPTENPLPPFGASLDGVRALLPGARIDATTPASGKGVTTTQVTAWLVDLSRRVSIALEGWERLRSTPTAEETAAGLASPRDEFAALARDLVHNAAASYTEAARFPERAEGGYPAVLWARFADGLASLTASLAVRLDDGSDATPDPAAGGGAESFPPPMFSPGIRF